MTGKDDLTLDMEKGSHEGTDESHDSKATPSPKRRVWPALGALAFLGIVVFIVGFSITYVNENKNDSGDGDGTVEPPEKVKYEYVSSTNPFKVKLSMFDQDIARGYTNSSELEEDLGNVARFLLNNVLNRNLGKSGYGHVGIGQRNPNMPFPTFGEEDMDFAAGAPEMVADESKNAVGDEFDDYGTNNQEEGVEEGDVIVSDGENGKKTWMLVCTMDWYEMRSSHAM